MANMAHEDYLLLWEAAHVFGSCELGTFKAFTDVTSLIGDQ